MRLLYWCFYCKEREFLSTWNKTIIMIIKIIRKIILTIIIIIILRKTLILLILIGQQFLIADKPRRSEMWVYFSSRKNKPATRINWALAFSQVRSFPIFPLCSKFPQIASHIDGFPVMGRVKYKLLNLISWWGNFSQTDSLCRFSGESPENLQKISVYGKFLRPKIRWKSLHFKRYGDSDGIGVIFHLLGTLNSILWRPDYLKKIPLK